MCLLAPAPYPRRRRAKEKRSRSPGGRRSFSRSPSPAPRPRVRVAGVERIPLASMPDRFADTDDRFPATPDLSEASVGAIRRQLFVDLDGSYSRRANNMAGLMRRELDERLSRELDGLRKRVEGAESGAAEVRQALQQERERREEAERQRLIRQQMGAQYEEGQRDGERQGREMEQERQEAARAREREIAEAEERGRRDVREAAEAAAAATAAASTACPHGHRQRRGRTAPASYHRHPCRDPHCRVCCTGWQNQRPSPSPEVGAGSFPGNGHGGAGSVSDERLRIIVKDELDQQTRQSVPRSIPVGGGGGGGRELRHGSWRPNGRYTRWADERQWPLPYPMYHA